MPEPTLVFKYMTLMESTVINKNKMCRNTAMFFLIRME